MTVLLECVSPATKRRWTLRQGEAARVGRSRWVEFSVPEDEALADEHFVLSYTNQPTVTSLGDSTIRSRAAIDSQATDQRVTQTFEAGNCLFTIRRLGQFAELSKPIGSAVSGEANKYELVAIDDNWLAEVGISVATRKLLDGVSSVEAAMRLIASTDERNEAMEVGFALLPYRDQVAVCLEAVESSKASIATSLRSDLVQWQKKPCDDIQSRIGEASIDLPADNPWTWIARLIAWSKGTIQIDTENVVQFPRSLATRAGITALKLIASENSTDLRKSIVQKILERYSGNLALKDVVGSSII